MRRGDSLVTRCRNDCVAVFLANPRFTHLFFIDADIGFTPEAAFRLLLADRDVAAGVYPLKREDLAARRRAQGTTRARFEALYQRYTVNSGREGEASIELSIDRDGFMEVREAPTGFMCIKRRVFDRLIEAYPDMRYVPDWPKGTYPEGGVHYRFFDVMVDPESRRYLSEDYGFCRIWEEIGGKVYRRRQFRPLAPGRAPLHRRFRRHASHRVALGRRRARGPAHAHHRAREPRSAAQACHPEEARAALMDCSESSTGSRLVRSHLQETASAC